MVNIRTVEDLHEAWSDILKFVSGLNKPVLWCDGLREVTSNATGQKRGHSYDSDDDLETEESQRPGKKKGEVIS